jgi:hypothetical protein
MLTGTTCGLFLDLIAKNYAMILRNKSDGSGLYNKELEQQGLVKARPKSTQKIFYRR